MAEEKKDENRKLTKIEKLEKDVKAYYHGYKSIKITIIRVIIVNVITIFGSIFIDNYIFNSMDTKNIFNIIPYLILASLIYIILIILIRNYNLLKYITYKQMSEEEKEKLK